MLCNALFCYNAHKLLHDSRPKTYLRRYSVATLAEKWAQDTYSMQPWQTHRVFKWISCSICLNLLTIISSHLSNNILLKGHHRPPSRDLTTRPPSTRKHPGHTQCLLPLHQYPSMMRVRKLAEEPWRYSDDVFAIWNHGQIYHRHFSNNERVTPHHHVHSRMVHGPGDIPESHPGDPIQNKCVPKTAHTRKCLCPDSCHPQPCTSDPQYTKTINLG